MDDPERDDLIEQIRELRAHVRRSDEAIRVVAEMIDSAVAAWRDNHGHMPASGMSPLQFWLRRNQVRIVRGDSGTVYPLCSECRVRGAHKMDCSRAR